MNDDTLLFVAGENSRKVIEDHLAKTRAHIDHAKAVLAAEVPDHNGFVSAGGENEIVGVGAGKGEIPASMKRHKKAKHFWVPNNTKAGKALWARLNEHPCPDGWTLSRNLYNRGNEIAWYNNGLMPKGPLSVTFLPDGRPVLEMPPKFEPPEDCTPIKRSEYFAAMEAAEEKP